MDENSYGWRKRLGFVSRVVRETAPATALDIGCGTGAALTVPLAEAFPALDILGVDSDAVSIGRAMAEPHPGNVRFSEREPAAERQFDLVIASEVLEHVEDPQAFLDRLRDFARPGGRIVVTVPNGYGPFEACALFEALFNLSGAQRMLRRALGRAKDRQAASAAPPLTMAVSPHINFFSRGALLALFAGAGLRLRRFQTTTFLCGYGIDSLIAGERIVAWNARAADRLPAWCASDWMFELEPGAPPDAGTRPPWRGNGWGRFRRRLNERRWGLR